MAPRRGGKSRFAELHARLDKLVQSESALQARMLKVMHDKTSSSSERYHAGGKSAVDASSLKQELYEETKTRLMIARERRKVEEALRWEAALALQRAWRAAEAAARRRQDLAGVAVAAIVQQAATVRAIGERRASKRRPSKRARMQRRQEKEQEVLCTPPRNKALMFACEDEALLSMSDVSSASFSPEAASPESLLHDWEGGDTPEAERARFAREEASLRSPDAKLDHTRALTEGESVREHIHALIAARREARGNSSPLAPPAPPTTVATREAAELCRRSVAVAIEKRERGEWEEQEKKEEQEEEEEQEEQEEDEEEELLLLQEECISADGTPTSLMSPIRVRQRGDSDSNVPISPLSPLSPSPHLDARSTSSGSTGVLSFLNPMSLGLDDESMDSVNEAEGAASSVLGFADSNAKRELEAIIREQLEDPSIDVDGGCTVHSASHGSLDVSSFLSDDNEDEERTAPVGGETSKAAREAKAVLAEATALLAEAGALSDAIHDELARGPVVKEGSATNSLRAVDRGPLSPGDTDTAMQEGEDEKAETVWELSEEDVVVDLVPLDEEDVDDLTLTLSSETYQANSAGSVTKGGGQVGWMARSTESVSVTTTESVSVATTESVTEEREEEYNFGSTVPISPLSFYSCQEEEEEDDDDDEDDEDDEVDKSLSRRIEEPASLGDTPCSSAFVEIMEDAIVTDAELTEARRPQELLDAMMAPPSPMTPATTWRSPGDIPCTPLSPAARVRRIAYEALRDGASRAAMRVGKPLVSFSHWLRSKDYKQLAEKHQRIVAATLGLGCAMFVGHLRLDQMRRNAREKPKTFKAYMDQQRRNRQKQCGKVVQGGWDPSRSPRCRHTFSRKTND